MGLDPLTGQLETKGSPFVVSLKENRAALLTIRETIERFDAIEHLIEQISSKKHPIQLSIQQGPAFHAEKFQVERDSFVEFLRSQRKMCADHLAKLGIDSDN